MNTVENTDADNEYHPMADARQARSKPNKLTLSVGIPIYTLMILPAILGFMFVGLGIVYTNGPRTLVFEISWLIFAFVMVGTSISSNASIIKEAQKLSRTYLTVFALFAGVWIYTSAVIAPSATMANYISGIGVIAILAGLAAAALKRRVGNTIIIRMSWALFVAMLLHAPFWIWLYILEAHNPEFDWNYRTPGYPAGSANVQLFR